MTQLNAPYPATAYLTGFLRKNHWDAVQADPSLELALRLFSKQGLERIASAMKGRPTRIRFFLERFEDYLAVVEPVIRFLQGKDPSLALRIVGRDFLPEGSSFKAMEQQRAVQGDPDADPIGWAFGTLGTQDRAKYLASLFVDDLAMVVRDGVDSRFELSRYGERLSASASSFDLLHNALMAPRTIVEEILEEVTLDLLKQHRPDVVGLTIPFPGNVYGAFRMASLIRRGHPGVKIVLGGGYVNTELRQLTDPRVFDHIDFITLDDGEIPLVRILEFLQGKRSESELYRTYIEKDGRVEFISDPNARDVPQRDAGIPTYEGLPLGQYLSVFEMLNPMHRIWSDGRWNKLTLAHGCYWRKCSFCDVSLDYIGRYDPSRADLVIDRMEALIRETGQRGFHFVDEAAPPALLRILAERLLERKVVATWWGNIRFEKSFTPELAQLLRRAGCVAVSGGLEVASDRLLKLMKKGVTVEQVARVTHAFSQAGIMVHAYLMYGFPTQTEQETIDALERVRQLFEAGCIQSAFWHRFSVTAHSPIGRNPQDFGIRLLPEEEISFARNDLKFLDPTGCDHDRLGVGLRKALYNYMNGVGWGGDVRAWFKPCKVPAACVPPDLITRAIRTGL